MHTYTTCIACIHYIRDTLHAYIHTGGLLSHRTHIHTYMHAYIHTHIHEYITYIHACIHTYRWAAQPPCMHAYIHTYIRTYIHTYRWAAQPPLGFCSGGLRCRDGQRRRMLSYLRGSRAASIPWRGGECAAPARRARLAGRCVAVTPADRAGATPTGLTMLAWTWLIFTVRVWLG